MSTLSQPPSGARPARKRVSVSRMIRTAEQEFDKGTVTTPIPVHFDSFPEKWSAEAIQVARVLSRSDRGDEAGQEYTRESFPSTEDPGGRAGLDANVRAIVEAWRRPRAELMETVGLPLAEATDFRLYTEVSGWACWDATYEASAVTERVGVFTVDMDIDSRIRFPVPWFLYDRRRVFEAVEQGLTSGRPSWFDTPFGTMSCSHRANELFRLLLVAEGWERDRVWAAEEAELYEIDVHGAVWGYQDLKEKLGETGPPVVRSLHDTLYERGVVSPHVREAGGSLALAAFQHMVVCRECGKLAGGRGAKSNHVSVSQTCDCARDTTETWPGYDFNTAVELCRCCGQVLLRSGSRWSVWFCGSCLELVRSTNAALGRYAIPIGRHSLHGGVGLRGDVSDLDIEIFVATFQDLSAAFGRVSDWAGRVVKGILRENWLDLGHDVPLIEYLAQCRADEKEAQRRFREMVRYFNDSR